jgi:hypothetical protein
LRPFFLDYSSTLESSTSKTIKVEASQLSAEIKPIGFKDPLKPCVYEKPYEVTFEINIIKALPGNYNGRILIADPTLTIVGDIKFSVNLKGSEEHITEKWKAPEDSKPGTYYDLFLKARVEKQLIRRYSTSKTRTKAT